MLAHPSSRSLLLTLAGRFLINLFLFIFLKPVSLCPRLPSPQGSLLFRPGDIFFQHSKETVHSHCSPSQQHRHPQPANERQLFPSLGHHFACAAVLTCLIQMTSFCLVLYFSLGTEYIDKSVFFFFLFVSLGTLSHYQVSVTQRSQSKI